LYCRARSIPHNGSREFGNAHGRALEGILAVSALALLHWQERMQQSQVTNPHKIKSRSTIIVDGNRLHVSATKRMKNAYRQVNRTFFSFKYTGMAKNPAVI
jgi:hypothetical protein